MVVTMLQIRVEGDPAESQALVDLLAAAGVELCRVGARERSTGLGHRYADARLPGWTPNDPSPAASEPDRRPPYRTRAYVEQAALPTGGSRPTRRRPR